METSLGSPRSSSGYGSSEEDNQTCTGARRRRRRSLAQHCATVADTGRVSTPQTPQSLSLSDTGSSLSSPFSIDFRSVFDDAMPDFSDLTAFSDPDDVQLSADLMGTWTNELDDSDFRPLTKPTLVDVDRCSVSKKGDKRLLHDDNHILVSLLKRPKAELDWITTGQQPSADQFLNGPVCSATAAGVIDRVASASPLQRLKALTRSDVVNHAAAHPPSPKAPTVSLPAAVPIKVLRPSDALCYDGRPLVVQSQTGLSPFSVRQGPMSLPPRTDYGDGCLSSLIASRTSAARRVTLELDDHRYSSPMPRSWPPSYVAAVKPSRARRPSADGRCPRRRLSTKSRSTLSSSSSALEMLLRTSKQLRPNDGSDASLATCRQSPTVKRPPPRRRVDPIVDKTLTATATFIHGGPSTSLLDALIADREVAASTPTEVRAAATATSLTSELLTSSSSDSFSLFSEHLLCDAQGVIDVGLQTYDQAAWTPSRLDDKVTQTTHSLCLFLYFIIINMMQLHY